MGEWPMLPPCPSPPAIPAIPLSQPCSVLFRAFSFRFRADQRYPESCPGPEKINLYYGLEARGLGYYWDMLLLNWIGIVFCTVGYLAGLRKWIYQGNLLMGL